MDKFQKFLTRLHPYCLSSIASALTICQGIFVFFFHEQQSELLEWIGWICLWSAGLFGILPIIIFYKNGDVVEGQSYVHTTKLVDTGLYAIVRHPQNGTAWLLINLGMILINWHLFNVILGFLSMVLVYADTYKADQRCIEKFGDQYREYMRIVPSVNILIGIYRMMRRKIIRNS